MTGPERRIAILLAMAHGVVHALELAYPAVLPFVAAEFGIGPFLLGLFANISAFALGAAALPAGLLTDRFGARRVVAASLAGSALFSMVVWLSRSELTLLVGLTGLGIVNGVYHPAGLALISRTIAVHVRGFAFHGMGGSLGVALPALLAVAIAAVWSWHELFLVLAAVALASAALIALTPIQETAPADGAPALPSDLSLRGSFMPLAVLFAASVLTGIIYRGYLTFLPAYMDQRVTISVLGLDPLTVARSSTTIALVLGILGQYASGAVAAGRRLPPLAVAVSAALVPLLVLMGFTENLVLVPVVCLFMLVNSMLGPIFNSLVTDHSPPVLRGRIFGGYFFVSLGLGSFGASLAGLLAESFGMEWVFPGMGAVALVLSVLVSSLLVVPAARFAAVAR